jgi:hypothetical protein
MVHLPICRRQAHASCLRWSAEWEWRLTWSERLWNWCWQLQFLKIDFLEYFCALVDDRRSHNRMQLGTWRKQLGGSCSVRKPGAGQMRCAKMTSRPSHLLGLFKLPLFLIL